MTRRVFLPPAAITASTANIANPEPCSQKTLYETEGGKTTSNYVDEGASHQLYVDMFFL